MGIHGLEQSEGDPYADCEEVEVLCNAYPDDWNTNSTKSKRHDFNWVRVFRSKSKWCGVTVVLLVDVLVERSVVEQSVERIVPCIL